jgi:hypothetical protein
METPNGDWCCRFRLQVCRHSWSLLAAEMAGKHSAPIRLHMPIKYSYKRIKRIGLGYGCMPVFSLYRIWHLGRACKWTESIPQGAKSDLVAR